MKYEAPKCELIEISEMDIIRTSNPIDESGSGLGGDTEWIPIG